MIGDRIEVDRGRTTVAAIALLMGMPGVRDIVSCLDDVLF
jgi:hypothetical protein